MGKYYANHDSKIFSFTLPRTSECKLLERRPVFVWVPVRAKLVGDVRGGTPCFRLCACTTGQAAPHLCGPKVAPAASQALRPRGQRVDRRCVVLADAICRASTEFNCAAAVVAAVTTLCRQPHSVLDHGFHCTVYQICTCTTFAYPRAVTWCVRLIQSPPAEHVHHAFAEHGLLASIRGCRQQF